MSWYMQSPSIQNRGIKVDGYANMLRPNLSLSWGMDQNQYQKFNRPSSIVVEKDVHNTIPNYIKVMNENKDEEELDKLIKSRKPALQQREVNDYNKNQQRSRSSQDIQNQVSNRSVKNSQFSKKVRYLQNNLLPNCKKDSMDMILDHNLCQEVSLQQSRISKETIATHHRPESHISLGNGYNPFNPIKQAKKDLTQQLKEMYQYQQKYKARMQRNHLKLG